MTDNRPLRFCGQCEQLLPLTNFQQGHFTFGVCLRCLAYRRSSDDCDEIGDALRLRGDSDAECSLRHRPQDPLH